MYITIEKIYVKNKKWVLTATFCGVILCLPLNDVRRKRATICSTLFHLFGQRRLSLLHIKKKRTAPPVLFFLRFGFPFFCKSCRRQAALAVSNLCKNKLRAFRKTAQNQFFCRLLQNKKKQKFWAVVRATFCTGQRLCTFCEPEPHCKRKKQAQKKDVARTTSFF